MIAKIFGKEAKDVAEKISGGEHGLFDRNMKVSFNIRSVEGNTVVEVSFDL